MRTQVAIVGGGPAGLLLSHLLHLRGVDSVVLERRSQEHVQQRVRAGVLEQNSVDLLEEAGVADRLKREGDLHRGVYVQFDGEYVHIPFTELTGRAITVYGQAQVVKDLGERRAADGGRVFHDVEDVSAYDVTTDRPRVRFRHEGVEHDLHADYVVGADGYHGVCRESIPSDVRTVYERVYPFGWLGILAEVPPSTDELIYANHRNGFALHSMRSAQISRLYLQCSPDESLDEWPDERIWGELNTRLASDGWELRSGPIIDKSVTAMRSFVSEPMRFGNLFLAGDSAHIVPPTGAKGLNLAMADVYRLAGALDDYYGTGSTTGLDTYSEDCLRRVWRVQQFSYWMTSLTHRFEGPDAAFDRRLQRSQFNYLRESEAARISLAENYVGLPLH